MGSELIKKGIGLRSLPDLLNIENSDDIAAIHKSYYDAGSDMCQSNTFGSTVLNLKRHNIENRMEEIIENGLKNIRGVCPSNGLVVGDIGPSGDFRPPVGKATPEGWNSSFSTQVKLMEKSVDLWHVETISDILEMEAAVIAVKSISKKPIIASLTYKNTRRGYFTIMGDSLQKCVEKLDDLGVSVIGSNCTLGSAEMIDIVEATKKFTDKPISVKPNAGQPEVDVDGSTSYKQLVKDFVGDIAKMIKSGAKIVGGCCGTSPKTIKEIRKLINSLKG
jgi:5-methyltetrahydrofolate--homocysteine methyltransferase